MGMKERESIKQIIPAPDWFAAYANSVSYPLHRTPLACWALIDEGDGEQRVVGMDDAGYICECEEFPSFLGYFHETQDPIEKFGKRAKEFVLKQQALKPTRFLCPFHEEKTPSFHLNYAKNIYKCFGCGKEGEITEDLKAKLNIGVVATK